MNNNQNMSSQKGNGSIIAIVIIVLVLLVGIIYVWRSRGTGPVGNETDIDSQAMSDEQASSSEAVLNTQSSSDDLGAIDADLNSTPAY